MAQLEGEARSAYVRAMFDRIAARYNLMNRIISGAQDQRWRRFVVDMAQLPTGGRLLDLATGTGDIAFEALKRQPDALVHGADFALQMMLTGKRHARFGHAVHWTGADALRLPYADSSFDAVVSGYLMRNVADMPGALAEQWRVLKPGGRIVILDTSPPPPSLVQPFIRMHLRFGIPLLGRLIAGRDAAEAYRYLPESTRAFATPDELTRIMKSAGYTGVAHRTFMFGAMAVHWGSKAR